NAGRHRGCSPREDARSVAARARRRRSARMTIGQTQCFMIALVIAGAIGAQRGWGREVITCAILLGTVLFLANGGLNFLLGGLNNLSRGVSLNGAGADPTT